MSPQTVPTSTENAETKERVVGATGFEPVALPGLNLANIGQQHDPPTVPASALPTQNDFRPHSSPKARDAAQLINQTGGCAEYFTPQPIIEAAHSCMGCIDLDPASSPQANERVRAVMFYTKMRDGLDFEWMGNIWMNHPFGRGTNKPWVSKLEAEFKAGNVRQACCITFACTSEGWFQPLLRRPQCFLSPRTNYVLPDGGVLRGVTKGSVVTYYGKHVTEFVKAFAGLGVVKLPV